MKNNMHYKIKELHKLITALKNEEGLSEDGVTLLEGYALGLETILTGRKPTDKYKYCNHYHEMTDKHELVDFGDEKFVANKEAIPLLKALNEVGLKTRTHHIDENEIAFISILLNNVEIEVKEINEFHATRTKYNDKKELLIKWTKNE